MLIILRFLYRYLDSKMLFLKITKLINADGPLCNLQSLSPTQANFQSIIVVSINYNHRFKITAKSSTIDIYSKILMRESCDVDKIARVLGDFGIRKCKGKTLLSRYRYFDGNNESVTEKFLKLVKVRSLCSSHQYQDQLSSECICGKLKLKLKLTLKPKSFRAKKLILRKD